VPSNRFVTDPAEQQSVVGKDVPPRTASDVAEPNALITGTYLQQDASGVMRTAFRVAQRQPEGILS